MDYEKELMQTFEVWMNRDPAEAIKRKVDYLERQIFKNGNANSAGQGVMFHNVRRNSDRDTCDGVDRTGWSEPSADTSSGKTGKPEVQRAPHSRSNKSTIETRMGYNP